MNHSNQSFIETYQAELLRNPKSQVFAALAEALRKNQEFEKALQIAKTGVSYHPRFASGHVALGQTLLDLTEYNEALLHFQEAAKLSPENILAHLGAARCYLQERLAKEALNAYKMVLYLNPDHKEAQKAVRKLESLTADEFSEDLFQIRSLDKLSPQASSTVQTLSESDKEARRLLRRKLSLLDAFLVRADYDRAQKTLRELRAYFPDDLEVQKRQEALEAMVIDDESDSVELISPVHRSISTKELKKQALTQLLQRISDWKSQDQTTA